MLTEENSGQQTEEDRIQTCGEGRESPAAFAPQCVCGTDGRAGLDCYRKVQEHPCFNEKAQHKFGRMHLPVAPKCNVRCNYCIRRFDCVNETRPGVTSQVITPLQALAKVRGVVERYPNIKTIAIAGPGEPLANEETFTTFGLVRDRFPELPLCMSTNGLLLPEKLDLICDVGVSTLTVTMNAVDPKIGQAIYSYIRYRGKYYRGQEAAELLLDRQLLGIRKAVERGVVVKINAVMIPSVNGDHLIEIARKARELGAYMLNIMPLIPQYKFARLPSPSPAERKRAQDACAAFIMQMRHCRQCRADAVGLLGKDMKEDSDSQDSAGTVTDYRGEHSLAFSPATRPKAIHSERFPPWVYNMLKTEPNSPAP